MTYKSVLPASALLVLVMFTLLTSYGIVPGGDLLLEQLKHSLQDMPDGLLFLIILAESLIYLGFYFPGQFFAVVLVVMAGPDFGDMLRLTFIMVLAATTGSFINYSLGRLFSRPSLLAEGNKFRLRNLLLAMLHTNALAFYMFAQGAQRHSIGVIWLAGLLNLPYYLLLIAGTVLLSDQVMYVAETPQVLAVFLVAWLVVAVFLDWRAAHKVSSAA
ncbi:hypothetical protein [Oceanospirillum sediminis]|uniref:Membrane-associated protein n=1 Tax=Oceanospirillum sediminis TaxID=2760088 RepID=A0A839IKJ9_9GAMM|nr:hypothetical protein [Oceanospirillum sediminis]MBB1485883.1 hypothetical protein [Oceanospirillum sediminis]